MPQVIRKVKAKARPVSFYQSDDTEDRQIVQRGNGSTSDRSVILNESQRNMARVISDMLDEKGSKCKDNCIIPKDIQPHLSQAGGLVREFSREGKIEDGLNNWSDQNKRVKKFFKWYDDGTSITFKVVVIAAVTTVIGFMALGFIQKIKQGGM